MESLTRSVFKFCAGNYSIGHPHFDRYIKFGKKDQYAVILSTQYGINNYRTYPTKKELLADYSHYTLQDSCTNRIIDRRGHFYKAIYGGEKLINGEWVSCFSKLVRIHTVWLTGQTKH